MAKSLPTPADPSTEEKIKEAARQVFHQKGFSATRTRDIADAAGINLALLNYYFRSKEKLFDLIMIETMQRFLQSIASVINDPNSTFKEKIESIASRYIDLLTREPEIPLFIMSELKGNAKKLLETIQPKQLLIKSIFFRQFQESVQAGHIPPQNFIHFMMNLLGLINFPFIAAPLFKALGDFNDEQYSALVFERKKKIPQWINAILNSNVIS